MSVRVRWLMVTAALALLAVPGAAVAADSDGGGLSVSSTDVSEHPVVRLTVTAPRAEVGSDLPPGAFTLTENGDDRELEVSSLPDEALQVALLVDTSGSMAGAPLEAVKAAAVSFVERMPQGVQISVIPFATAPREASPFTDDRAAATAALSGLEADGRTATYDAVALAVARFESLPEGRRVVVLISDGEDNQSETALEEAAALLTAGGVTLHVIELETRFSDVDALRRLAAAGGGEVTSIDDPAAVEATYDAIRSKLLDQYELEYRSEAGGSTEVRVVIQTADVRAEARATVELPALPEPVPTRPEPTPEPAPEPELAVPPTGADLPRPPGLLGFLTGPNGLAAGAFAVYVALAVVFMVMFAPKPVRTTLHSQAWGGGPRKRTSSLAGMGDWAEERIDRTLRRHRFATNLGGALEQAGILLKPSEFVVVAGASALVALAVGMLLRGPLLGVPLMALTLFGFRVYVRHRAEKRRAAFNAQLADTLQLLSGSLRAGYGLLQAVDAVAKDADAPTSEEFRRIVLESRLGRDLGEALHAMGERLSSDDLAWVVQAIDIHREVGGDLAEVLDRVGETIRDRDQVGRQIKSLSAEGRLSAKILIALPFFVAAGLSIMTPGYLRDLTSPGAGRLMLTAVAVFLTVGAVWIQRLVKIEF